MLAYLQRENGGVDVRYRNLWCIGAQQQDCVELAEHCLTDLAHSHAEVAITLPDSRQAGPKRIGERGGLGDRPMRHAAGQIVLRLARDGRDGVGGQPMEVLRGRSANACSETGLERRVPGRLHENREAGPHRHGRLDSYRACVAVRLK